MIQIKCPKCNNLMSVPESMIGQPKICTVCGNVTLIPDLRPQLFTPIETKPPIYRGNNKNDNNSNSVNFAWGYIFLALGAILGGYIGRGSIMPEEPVLGVIMGGWIGAILGTSIGIGIAYALK